MFFIQIYAASEKFLLAFWLHNVFTFKGAWNVDETSEQ